MWLIFSLLTALLEAVKDVLCKKSLNAIDEVLVAGSIFVFSIPLLLPVLLFIEIPVLSGRFWIALPAGTILNVLATLLYIKALKHSDLSLSLPMVTFTPVFLLLTSPLIVGEFPDPKGLIGILLIVLGAYRLNSKDKQGGFWKPFKALVRERGPRYMLLVAFIWSLTSNIDKVGILHSSVVFWVITTHLASALFFVPLVLFRIQRKPDIFKWSELKPLILIGMTAILRTVFQMSAIALTLVAYVISIKRTSVIFGILFGYVIFREKGLSERLSGAVIMVMGVFVIAWF
jgi:uncharacterized membrane protein